MVLELQCQNLLVYFRAVGKTAPPKIVAPHRQTSRCIWYQAAHYYKLIYAVTERAELLGISFASSVAFHQFPRKSAHHKVLGKIDIAGSLISLTDPKGQSTVFTYALDDSVLTKTYQSILISTSEVSYSYNIAYPRLTNWTDYFVTTSINVLNSYLAF